MSSVAASHAPNLVLMAAVWIGIGLSVGIVIVFWLASLLMQAPEPAAPSEDVRRLHKSLRQQIDNQRLRKAERRTSQRSPALFALDGVPAAERTGKTAGVLLALDPIISAEFLGPQRGKRIGKSAKPSWPPQASIDNLPPDGGLVPLPQLPGVKR